MKIYEIKQFGEDCGGLIIDDLRLVSDIMGGIEYEEVGNKYVIEIKEMTEAQYNSLPEWGGF